MSGMLFMSCVGSETGVIPADTGQEDEVSSPYSIGSKDVAKSNERANAGEAAMQYAACTDLPGMVFNMLIRNETEPASNARAGCCVKLSKSMVNS